MSTLERRIAQARAHRHAGRSHQAEAVCQKILKSHPDHPDALQELSFLAAANGQYPLAAILLGRAIQASGPTSELCRQLAEVLRMQGRSPEAAACFRQAIQINPADRVARMRLAGLLLDSGHPKEAEKVVAPLIGARAASPGDALSLGTLFFQLGLMEAAAEQFQHAARLKPCLAPAHYNLGVVRMMEQRLDESEAALRQAISCDPGYASAHNNLGIVLRAQGRVEESLAFYRAAVNANPLYTEAWYNLGLGLQEQERLAEACEAYEKALAINPRHADAWNNLGNTLMAAGKAERAKECFSKAFSLNPEHQEAGFNAGICNLLLGHLPEGWDGYEFRFRQRGAWQRFTDFPRWMGDPLDGRRLLLHAEQGIGDVIQFARLTSLIPKDRGRIILECHPPLVTLCRTLEGVDQVVGIGDPLPLVSCQLPLLSIPATFRLGLDDIPRLVPYVQPDPMRVAAWSKLLKGLIGQPGNCLRVGLVWAGNRKHQHDHRRSLPFAELAALSGLPEVAFLSLQFGDRAGEARCPPPGLALINLEDRLGDMADTAALMENLDLLVTVDTAMAHLGGALGLPTWTMLAYAADWRWMLDRDDSPWYPTMRLFRQSSPGDWRSVLWRVRKELETLVTRSRSPGI